MSRGVGETGLVADLPDAVVAVTALLTQFGAVWFVFLLLAVFAVAVFGPVDAPVDGTAVVALSGATLLAVGLTTLLKAVFALPRPPGADTVQVPAALTTLAPLYEYAATGDGFGFPSGHALLATAFYGTLAHVWSGRRPTRLAVAVVTLVALTRVVLGVHYLVDVVVGALLGLVVVALATRGPPTRTLTVAVAVSLVAVAVAPDVPTLLTLSAAAVGRLTLTRRPRVQ